MNLKTVFVKNVLKIKLLLNLFIFGFTNAQLQKEVALYSIEDILNNTYGINAYYNNGAITRFEKNKLNDGKDVGFNIDYLSNDVIYGYKGFPQVSSIGCKVSVLYQKIRFDQIDSIEDYEQELIMNNSPLKKILIKFKGENAVMKSQSGTCTGNHATQWVNEMIVVYPDTGDNRKKLIENFRMLKNL